MQVPHPFAAVRRGIREELSPLLDQVITRSDVRLTGLSFDLRSLQPDALFVVTLDRTASEVLDDCKRQPGRDFYEGDLHLMTADFEATAALQPLQGDSWNPGGQASLVRALELVRIFRRRHQLDYASAFRLLRAAI
jgi:hypothetical protein